MRRDQVRIEVAHKGQLYVWVDDRPHKTRKGEMSKLVEWSSECADCCSQFTVFTGRTPWQVTRYWNRRCNTCKAPGRRVNS
jgi:hypothetical protein